MTREEIPEAVSRLLDDRPVRWCPRVVGDYDGRDRTLQVFNADARDQRNLLTRIRSVREEIERVAGGAIVIIFHSVKQSNDRYKDFLETWATRKERRAPAS